VNGLPVGSRQGLLQASFIPPKAIRDVRDMVRSRKRLVSQRTQEINRIQKVLETANIKLASVASDVVGVSGRLMLQALIEGKADASALAELARGTLRRKLPQLQEALAWMNIIAAYSSTCSLILTG